MVLVDAVNNNNEYMEFLNIHGAEMQGIAAEVTKDAEELFKLISQAIFLFGFLGIFKRFFEIKTGMARG